MFLYVKNPQVLNPYLSLLRESPRGEINSKVYIKDISLNIEVADSKEERATGLSGREKLATDSGMIFIYENAERYSFWMKGVKFPLDFIWIMNDKIVDITEFVQPPALNQTDELLPR